MLAAILQGGFASRSLLGLSYSPLASATQLISLQQASFAKAAAKPTRAVATSKAGKKTQKDLGTTDTTIQRVLLALAPQEISDLKLSPEEKADAAVRAKEYSRRKMAQHREWQKDITLKIKLRDEAIAALPEELRAAAREPDFEPFPANRQMWTITPPIPGFQEQQETATAAKFAKGSRRR